MDRLGNTDKAESVNKPLVPAPHVFPSKAAVPYVIKPTAVADPEAAKAPTVVVE